MSETAPVTATLSPTQGEGAFQADPEPRALSRIS